MWRTRQSPGLKAELGVSLKNRKVSFLSHPLRHAGKAGSTRDCFQEGSTSGVWGWGGSCGCRPAQRLTRCNYTDSLRKLTASVLPLDSVTRLLQQSALGGGYLSPSPCPLVVYPALLFQRASAKATSQCSVGWKSCLAIAPSPATTSSAANPATGPATSATQRMGVRNPHQGSTMTSMCSCPHSRGPL